MNNDHSTLPDELTGWNKRDLPKLKQFPLFFMNASVDLVTKSLTSFGNNQTFRVVYMGPRYPSNMKAFKSYCASERIPWVSENHLYSNTEMKRYTFLHNEEPEKFFPIRVSEYRLFNGMNPTIKKDDLRFDSDFQCGNLDLAIYVNPAEYDLLMRVDSNTKGHTAWFFFKVSNTNPKQKIKFNILNFSKKYLLYKDGMKPYVFKKSTGKWTQSGISINYAKRKFRYEASDNFYCESLSFYYEFTDSQPVYFAYCVPYSYSFLLHRLEEFAKKTPHLLKISYQNESTGGLPVPVLTITNFSTNVEKSTILCTGRLHPGETQGSWMMDGFIQQLLLPDSHYLRDKCIFKIVPMVNVDGVVLGNFRTGIMGRDLNRCFHLIDKYNEINLIRKIASEKRPETFIDFHGHSSKKNVFIYGPDFKLEDRNYLMSRVYPKLISKQTQAFRYYSCLFKISSSKKTTGRAVMLKEFSVDFAYTVEASTFGFGPIKNQKYFNRQEYIKVGLKIGESLTQFVKILRILPKRKMNKLKDEKKSTTQSKKKIDGSIQDEEVLKAKKKTQEQNQSLTTEEMQSLSLLQKNLLREIMKDQTVFEEQENCSEGGEDSDCEDETNDYCAGDIKKILSANFDPEKTSTSSKRRKLKQKQKTTKKVQESIEKYKKKKKEEKVKSKKNFLEKNKSLEKINRSADLLGDSKRASSKTIDIYQNEKREQLKSFESKISRLLDNSSNYMDGIIKKRQISRERGVSEGYYKYHEDTESREDLRKNNNVQYEWPYKKEIDKSSNHFKFETPEIIEEKYRKMFDSKPGSIKKKKEPLFSIKKSVLPMLGRSSENMEKAEKSMLSQILEEHQRKNKLHKNVRIMFL